MAGACFSQKSTMCQGFCLSPLAGVRNRVVSAWQELTGWVVYVVILCDYQVKTPTAYEVPGVLGDKLTTASSRKMSKHVGDSWDLQHFISPQLTKSFNSKGFVISIISLTGFANRPAIRIQPNDVTITPGTDHITIHCMKSEDSEVKWYRNGKAIKVHHDPDLQVTSDGSLFVRYPRKERDEGTYRCVVSSWEKVLISRLATVRFPCK